MSSTLADTTTEKGAPSLSTTSSKRLDLFFKTVRGITSDNLLPLVQESWKEDALDTLKLLFYTRDCRGGKGERAIFHTGMKWVIENYPNTFIKNLKLIPNFGRWSDLLFFLNTSNETVNEAVAELIANQLKEDLAAMNEGKPVTLCAKWCPTENCHFDKQFGAVSKICKALGLNELKDAKRQYRKVYLQPLRAYSKVIEVYMCAKQWDQIDYSKVPGQAMNKLKKAFMKNDAERFQEYQNKLKSGDKSVKVNATTVEPHDLCRQYMHGAAEDTIIEEQWKEIEKRVEKMGNMAHSIVVSDVSGSMSGTPMEVSIALGILISKFSLAPYTNQVLTFDETPTFFTLKGTTLKERVTELAAAPWGGSTNLQATFDLILNMAKTNNVRQEDMPTRLYIISDMQFDQADYSYKTNHEVIKEKYERAGYEMPQIVYWNVRANTTDFTAKANEQGVALLAGFSPSLLKAVINGEDFSPYGIMREAIDDERYKMIEL